MLRYFNLLELLKGEELLKGAGSIPILGGGPSGQEGASPESDQPAIPEVLPILPLKETVVYPLTAVPLAVGQPRSIRLVDQTLVGDRLVGMLTLRDASKEDPGYEDMFQVGTMAMIHRLARANDGTIRIIVQALERFRVVEFLQKEPYFKARIAPAPETAALTVELEALARNAGQLFQRVVSLVPYLPDELGQAALAADDPRQLTYFMAQYLRMDINQAQELLERDDVAEKLRALTAFMNRELEVLELGHKIQSEAQSEIEKTQREYFLRQQLKAIQKELGEADETEAEVQQLEQKIAKAGMPPEPEREARRELDRLRRLPPAAAEWSVIRTYLDWLVTLPWQTMTEDNLDIAHARQILDEDHYDLEKVKERIVEYLAVRKLRRERSAGEDGAGGMARAGILCFVGPPGVGKTSLGQSIARALGRKFIRMSLGGLRDEAEIRGHRRTYIGALPGRIIQGIRRADSRNPVFMLDEIDKVGADFRGDPSSALLEVLDPEQNREFRDHYLDLPFDLSQAMFITTANVVETISPPLLDRMEVIRIPGYTEEEKVRIAREYLIPRQLKEHGLKPEELEIPDSALHLIIRDYTREAGVRNLEREIANLARKVVRRIAGAEAERVVVAPDMLRELLGPQRFFAEVAERTEVPGVATGLAYTPSGGDILFIEATRMPGHKGLTLTGQLGEVMKESAQAALSYVRSKAAELGIPEDFFEHNDIHLHVPSGAVPKDGPSAGVAMVTALVSLLTRRPVHSTVGMTGEITLRGRVLPIGGVKEKVLAAARAGLEVVILPDKNRQDLEAIPEEVREEMRFIFVEHIEDVLAAALRDGVVPESPMRLPQEEAR